MSSISDSLVFVNVNIQCLRTKFNLVAHFCDDEAPDVFCACEHWLTNDESVFLQRNWTFVFGASLL